MPQAPEAYPLVDQANVLLSSESLTSCLNSLLLSVPQVVQSLVDLDHDKCQIIAKFHVECEHLLNNFDNKSIGMNPFFL
jgi:hypothetical protein